MNRKYRSRILRAAILSVGGLASAAAQSTVDEVVITARNRAETVQSTPLSISAQESSQIERARVQTFADVTRLTPSLVFDRGFSLEDTRPVIRGLLSSRGRPPSGVLIDGVDTSSESFGFSAGGSTLLNLRAIDVERIEVVTGPQSALYGRVAFGRAIDNVTKKPSGVFGVKLSAQAAQYDTYEVRGALTSPLNDRVDLVEMPAPPPVGPHPVYPLPPHRIGKHGAEPVPPKPYRLVADLGAPLMETVLQLAKRQRALKVHQHIWGWI